MLVPSIVYWARAIVHHLTTLLISPLDYQVIYYSIENSPRDASARESVETHIVFAL